MSKLNIVFDGPPGSECGCFVEVEDEDGRGVAYGEWIDADNGLWYLQFDDPRQVAGLRAEIAALRARTCAVCEDTIELQDSQAWDCGQPNSECPYCPHKVDEYRKEIAALQEAVRWFYEEGKETKAAHDAIERARGRE